MIDYRDVSRRIWNGLVSELLTTCQRKKILALSPAREGDLLPLSEWEVEMFKNVASRHERDTGFIIQTNVLDVDLSGIYYDQSVTFEGFIFDKLAISGSPFRCEVSFEGVIVNSSLSVWDAVFEADVDFTG